MEDLINILREISKYSYRAASKGMPEFLPPVYVISTHRGMQFAMPAVACDL
jgi:hypothetical protein